MSLIEAAKSFVEKTKDMARDAYREAWALIDIETRNEVRRQKMAPMFSPEHAQLESRKEHLSPSGKYKLVVTPFKTGQGTWNYTQGLVYRIDSDVPIAEIRRNYSSFPFVWIEGHPKGDFLIGGEDYQGQTVIELVTGKSRNNLSEGTDKGHGFCWSSYRYHEASKTLVVDGCHWACPYEFRFYDFSDPMSGWPKLKTDSYVDSGEKWPVIDGDTIRCFECSITDDDDDESEDCKYEDRPPIDKAIKTFRREGSKLVLVDEWVSDAEKERRRLQKEANEKFEAWKVEFKATDPLYLVYKARLKDCGLKHADYESYGTTHDSWCPDFKERECRWCRRILDGRSKGYTIDLEWAVKTGPIKLEIYKNGKSLDPKFFPHSVEGMNAAFDHAISLGGA